MQHKSFGGRFHVPSPPPLFFVVRKTQRSPNNWLGESIEGADGREGTTQRRHPAESRRSVVAKVSLVLTV